MYGGHLNEEITFIKTLLKIKSFLLRPWALQGTGLLTWMLIPLKNVQLQMWQNFVEIWETYISLTCCFQSKFFDIKILLFIKKLKNMYFRPNNKYVTWTRVMMQNCKYFWSDGIECRNKSFTLYTIILVVSVEKNEGMFFDITDQWPVSFRNLSALRNL